MNFYLPNGYLDFPRVWALPYPFVIIIGGRGTGKTFGALDFCTENKIKFAFFRRTQQQADIINKTEFSPLRPVARMRGFEFTMKPIVKGISAFCPATLDEDGKAVITGEPWGITAALSTISNVRGFDASWIDCMLYDEFIPEKGERLLKGEADTLFNAYETLNRNRELLGNPPLRLVLMANANDQASPVLLKLGLVKRLDTMAAKGVSYYADEKRGLAVVLLPDSPISASKADTALYKLTAGTDFAEMSLSNKFAYEERGNVAPRPIAEYKPFVVVGELCVYKHKSDNRYYVTQHKAGSPPTYGVGDNEIARFRHAYGWLYRAHMLKRVDFEDYACQVLFTQYIDA